MGCPINQTKRTNMVTDSQGIMRDNKDLVKNYDAEPLPTLIGKPERITALDARIRADEIRAGLYVNNEGVPATTPFTITGNITGGHLDPTIKYAAENIFVGIIPTDPSHQVKQVFVTNADFNIAEKAIDERTVVRGVVLSNITGDVTITAFCEPLI